MKLRTQKALPKTQECHDTESQNSNVLRLLGKTLKEQIVVELGMSYPTEALYCHA